MMEAKITCICSRILIADLDLTLRKGDTLYIEAGRAKSSKDLQRAWKNKGVLIRYVQRFQEQRAAPLPNPSTPHAVSRSAVIPDQREETLIDPDAIAARVVAALADRPGVAQQVRAEVARQLQTVQKNIVDAVIAAVRVEFQGAVRVGDGVTAVVATVKPVGSVAIDDDVPVFVPSKIGRDDLTGDIDVETSKVEGVTGVSDAAAALRAARKGKA